MADIAAVMKQQPQGGSHDKDDLHRKGTPWGTSIFRSESTCPDESLESQSMQVLANLPRDLIELLASEPTDLAADLDVAVYYRSAYASVSISAPVLQALSARRMGLEITTYPVEN